MHSFSDRELSDLHVAVHMGGYFAGVRDLPFGAKYVFSDLITDSIWNYAYGVDVSARQLPEVIASLHEICRDLGRAPALSITPSTQPAELARLVPSSQEGAEVWMEASSASLQSSAGVIVDIGVSRVESDQDLDAFCEVFDLAYGGDADEGPGYSGLPPEYVTALRRAASTRSVKVDHYLARTRDGRPAAIASTYSTGGSAGLYNVGTSPWARQRGLGRLVSQWALLRAAEDGFSHFFLQTEPDSPVERLYESIGFSRRFVAVTLALE